MTNNTNSTDNQKYNYDDTGSFDDNNISQYTLCTSKYMHVTPNSYILCIPRVPYSTTKMDVARAVENQIMTSGKGMGIEIEHFEYVKNVTFIRAFDQVEFDRLTPSISLSSSSFGIGSGSKERYQDPWYKIAVVNMEITPSYSENGFQYYTNSEDAFYNSVCRGDLVINSWPDAFFVANPRTYFQLQQQEQVQQKQSKKESKKNQEENDTHKTRDTAFQNWKYEIKLKQLERKVKEQQNTIRQYELDAIRTQNMVNEYAESMRFLTKQKLEFPELYGLHSSSTQVTSYIFALNTRYARVCVSDTTFLEANRNMKLKQLNGHVINACDDCDACQELIHSIDHTRSEERDEVFASIEKMICRVNTSVQKFEKLHVHAERSLFGLRNRRVFDDFSAYLNTALEIMEEVTYRVTAFTQDLEYARCYGRLYQPDPHLYEDATPTPLTLGYNYDYAEDAYPVYDEEYENDNTGIESTQQMLHYFDERNRELYNQQQQQQQQQQQEESSTSLDVVAGTGMYHEEAVIIEGEQDYVNRNTTTVDVKETTTTTTTVTTATTSETNNEKRRSAGWLSSWF